MTILTIIVTYNAVSWIDKCIPSVMSSSACSDILVVDNGSTDGTREYIMTNFPDVILIQSEENLFFGRGNNVGLQYAIDHGYDYVYLLNQDAWIDENTYECLIAEFEIDRQYGILSPMQLTPDRQSCEWFFSNCVLEKNYLNVLYQDMYFNRPKNVYEVDYVMAAHWMISRECLLQVGGFSPTFPHYGEDDNYCSRVRYHKFKIGIVPGAQAVHDAANKPKGVPMKKILYRQRIGYYTILSDLNNESKFPLFHCFTDSLSRVKKYKSIRPLFVFVRVLFDLGKIRRNIKKSKGFCAFLKCN